MSGTIQEPNMAAATGSATNPPRTATEGAAVAPNLGTPQTLKLGKKKRPTFAANATEDAGSMRESASVDSFAGFQSAPFTMGGTGLSSSTTHYEVDEEEEDGKPASKPSMFSFLSGVKVSGGNANITGFLTRQFTGADSGAFEVAATSSERGDDDDRDLTQEEEHEAFLLARLKHSRQSTAEGLAPESASNWFQELQSGFKTARDSILGANPSTVDENGVDWDFWGKVINDYENMIRIHPRQFQKQLHLGLPEPIRGMMWQLMCNSKNEALEAEYLELLTRNSRNEKIIIRDLARTFPNHAFFKDPQGQGQTSLFNVLKAYSIYDKEIGYCQGLPFVVGPLLLNMPEEQSFCVLVRLMMDYNFRDLYTPKMIGLQVINHQFDRLLQEQFPAVFNHLELQDVKATMYASQWFMTLFAYRFPLEIVFRILDVIFAEGAEAVLRFALALIKHNADHIVQLEFEQLVQFLKEGTCCNPMSKLVADASTITISKRKLDRWRREYLEVLRQQSPEVLEAEAVKEENRKLVQTYKTLERNHEALNREHVDMVNKYIESRGLHEQEKEKNEDLQEQVKSLKAIISMDRKAAEEQVKKEMDVLAEKNIQLTHINAMLEDTVADLEQKLLAARNMLAESENEKEDLKGKLARLSRVSK
ncbi:GTPase-activating protein [Kappamyces sp. JEL0829]|nr:GTPase-activating protein [Kappamyces sp. JEL0829]